MSSNFFQTKKTLKPVKNGDGPGYSYVSIVPDGDEINLVIGALYDDRRACGFSKATLTQLIDLLTEVRNTMGEE